MLIEITVTILSKNCDYGLLQFMTSLVVSDHSDVNNIFFFFFQDDIEVLLLGLVVYDSLV